MGKKPTVVLPAKCNKIAHITMAEYILQLIGPYDWHGFEKNVLPDINKWSLERWEKRET